MRKWYRKDIGMILLVVGLLLIVLIAASCTRKQSEKAITEYSIETDEGFIYMEASDFNSFNSEIFLDLNEPNEPDAYYVTLPWPPAEYKCIVHGDIDQVKESSFIIIIEEDRITNVCVRCLSDLINENINQLVKIDPND